MKRILVSSVALVAACAAPSSRSPDMARWEQRAANVTITRDDWGIAHIRGKTDADAVFGMMYAQAEDDFNRIEVNFLNSQGRLAEAEGESAIWRDLRMKLFIDPDSMKVLYGASAPWLRALMDAWADGLNYYLATHPDVKPRVLTTFEPWMALTFSEGSIGGDIEDVNLRQLEAFYGTPGAGQVAMAEEPVEREPSGSNGIAIAPSNTVEKHALLLINPHTSFFFRAEQQVTSDEGLNAYGASTWGQFFVYQGFNERAGWMHTSSGADVVDEYAETIVRRGDSVFYRFGPEERPVRTRTIAVPFRSGDSLATRTFTVYYTHRGPIVREGDGKWISVKLMNEPLKALEQSYSRTKAQNLAEYTKTMDLHTNSSNNTLFADADGNIAYFHANHVAVRNPKFDYTKPVDGSDPATDWTGVHSVDQSPNVINPASGWVYNSNNWPWSAAGSSSPRASAYPKYFETNGENPRGLHAIRVLEGRTDFTLASLLAAAYDSYLPTFAQIVPALVKAHDRAPAGPLKAKVAEAVDSLRGWDYRWGVGSVPTALAVYWGEELWQRAGRDAARATTSPEEYMATRVDGRILLETFATAIDTLTTNFGTWKTPWGEINRFQRLTDDIVHTFDDSKPSIPVGFTSARWGSLASFGARSYPQTKKMYGTSGNSFVAVVQFGDSVKARAVSAGGESGAVTSKHFNDQAQRYADGDLREVYFYPSQLKGHTEREYRPGK
ncbi:MAG: penicillin acylase family protein [Gemmatimonadaceae bacterium]|nr:penicillin acylase family protein [Gemmatimonadaceae bacterium]